MSKSAVRIVFSALVVLALLVGVYFTVQAASSKVSLNGERAFTTAGLMPDVQHVRSSTSGSDKFSSQADPYQNMYQDPGNGGCERDSSDD